MLLLTVSLLCRAARDGSSGSRSRPVKNIWTNCLTLSVFKHISPAIAISEFQGLLRGEDLLNFAVEKELIERNPLLGFRMLREEQRALRVMTLQEERELVEAVHRINPVIGVNVAPLGETGMRKSEGLNLKWSQVDLGQRMLSVDETKSGRPRYIPLSDFAVDQLRSLPRVIGEPTSSCEWK